MWLVELFRFWNAIALWKRVMIGLVIGGAFGLILRAVVGPEDASEFATAWLKPIGDGFVRLIKMVIMPLIATTIVAGVTAMNDPKKLGTIGLRAMALYTATTMIAVSLGLLAGSIIRPGKGVDYAGSFESESLADVKDKIDTASEAGSLTDRILEMIPENPIDALASGDVIPTIVFALLIGVGILVARERGAPLRQVFESAADVVMVVTKMIMELAPFGVAALIGWVMADRGLDVLTNLLLLAVALYLTCLVQIYGVYGLLIVKTVLRLPIMPFFRAIAEVQGIAFSTSSSNATLPSTISCAQDKLGVEKSVAGSVLPLGATFNMDGTAIYLGLIALFAAQAGGIELSPIDYLMVAVTATLVSVGAAGIPSASLILAAAVLRVVGVEDEQALMVIAFIFPFDRLLDMMRTVTNVSGDVTVACSVAKWEGVLDEEQFARGTRAEKSIPQAEEVTTGSQD